MRTFYAVLVNSLAAGLINTTVWFALTFWVYLETESVIAMSFMAGVFTITVAFSGFFLGSLVDLYPKKYVMILSSLCSFTFYGLAGLLFATTPLEQITDTGGLTLWIFIVLVLLGVLIGNLRGIAVMTLVTILVPEEQRDRANGLVGTTNGVVFLVASIFSGLIIGYLGVTWMLIIAVALSLAAALHIWTIPIPHTPTTAHAEHAHETPHAKGIDIPGTIRVIKLVPGLFPLIFFNTFNNFLGGIFMSLMDAYGLQLVSVQVWGTLWGILSLGFIVGGMVVAKRGLGPSPLQTLFRYNLVMWSICCVFTLQASILLLAAGMFIWLCLIPAVEAAEQTILQTVVPVERQGRVFGFAQSVEQAASPITSFMIGPIAQWVFIPFMTTGAGVGLIGAWFGTGPNRGLALLFTVAGMIGLIITLLALRSRSYRLLSDAYHTRARAQASALPEGEVQSVAL